MDTFHRLAGMSTETGGGDDNDAARDAHPAFAIPNPPPIPYDDADAASARSHSLSLSRRASRASLPINRQPSQKSLRAGQQRRQRSDSPPALPEPFSSSAAAAEPTASVDARSHSSSSAAAADEDEFAWGPTHPCFPHPNPHPVARSRSSSSNSTRVIRVRRDWLAAGDVCPQFANLYPEILEPLVGDGDFRALVAGVNARLRAACDPFSRRAALDALLGWLTGFLWEDWGPTGVRRGMADVERFVDEWNGTKEREGVDVWVVQPRKTGFMSLDFVVPDPGIDAVQEEEDVVEGGIGPAE